MRNGKAWRTFDPSMRVDAIRDALTVLGNSHPSNRIFAVVVEKRAVEGDPVEYAFEQLVRRFDLYLQRLHLSGDTQRGLLLFDKAVEERRLQTLATDFRTVGHRWGVLRNLAEVPVFVDSKASRLIQLADLVAYAVFRKYQSGDETFFDVIRNRFDQEGGIRHGLYVARVPGATPESGGP